VRLRFWSIGTLRTSRGGPGSRAPFEDYLRGSKSIGQPCYQPQKSINSPMINKGGKRPTPVLPALSKTQKAYIQSYLILGPTGGALQVNERNLQ
jgi:hypothetical protein